MCLGSLSGDSKVFQGIFQEVSTLKSVSKSFKGISQKFQEYFKKDWRVFQASFQWVSWVFERISKGISGKFKMSFKEVSGVS